MDQDDALRLRRLRYRSWHRGCKETDVILGNFADQALKTLDTEQMDIYEQLLDEQDLDIWNWLVEKEHAPKTEYEQILALLRKHAADHLH